MKKLVLFSIMCCMTLVLPVGLSAANAEPVVAHNALPDTAGVSKLLHRLDDIQRMDKSKLSASKKKELRKELKTIKAKLKHIGGGFYISGGALIIIIILLIILL